MSMREKVLAIYKNIPFVGKNGKNETLSYDYVKAADVVIAVRQALLDEGIVAEIDMDQVGQPYTIDRQSPKPPFSAVNVKCFIVCTDAETGETHKGTGLGAGADMGDKAIYKAQTGALKYALRHAFLIPDEEGADPEADASVDRDDARDTPALEGWKPSTAYPGGVTAPVAPLSGWPTPEGTPTPEPPPSVAAEKEPADDGTLPTPDELKAFKGRLRKIADSLAVSGGLGPDTNLPVNTKIRAYVTLKSNAPFEKTTKVSWEKILKLMESAGTIAGGWTKLAAAVNAACGIKEQDVRKGEN